MLDVKGKSGGEFWAGAWGPPRPPEALELIMQSPLMLTSPEVNYMYHFLACSYNELRD